MYKIINSNIFHWYTCIHYDSILINVGFKISRHCKSSLFYITTHTKSPTIVIKRQSSFLSWISWITQLHIHLFTNKYTITIDIMFCNNKSGQVEYHEYCWEQTDKIGVIHSKEIVNMSNTGNIQLASEWATTTYTASLPRASIWPRTTCSSTERSMSVMTWHIPMALKPVRSSSSQMLKMWIIVLNRLRETIKSRTITYICMIKTEILYIRISFH